MLLGQLPLILRATVWIIEEKSRLSPIFNPEDRYDLGSPNSTKIGDWELLKSRF